MNISFNKTHGLYFATVPRKQHRTFGLDASGHATGHAENIVASQTVSDCTVHVLLAYGSNQADVLARANLKLMQGA